MLKELTTEERSAVFSSCGMYRYRLERRWAQGAPLVWVMLNPSTADASQDDATIRRVRNFTKREGYPGFVVVNLFAYVTPYPKELLRVRDPVGPHNAQQVTEAVCSRDVVVAWGATRVMTPAAAGIAALIRKRAKSVRCLGRNKDRSPKHPVRLAKDTPLEVWT